MKIATIIGSVLAFGFSFIMVFAVQHGMSGMESNTEQDPEAWVEKELALSKRQIPVNCGNGVTWYDVEGKGRRIKFKYRINRDAAQIKAAEFEIKKALRTSHVSRGIPKGVRASCCFYDKKGQFIFSTKVN